jgi:hypothetical protein
MSQNTPAAAKVATPKKPTKAEAQAQAVAKKTHDVVAAKRSVIKPDYNYRTRSLARTLVDAIDDAAAKKAARAALRDLTTFAEIRDYAAGMIDNSQWDALLESWFDSGVKES